MTAPAHAKIVLSINDGADKTITGNGGRKLFSQGIDWWTSGDPAKRYKIIGVLTDSRTSGLFSGKAIGSKAIAGKVKATGGNAVILYKTSETDVGSITYLQQGQSYPSGADTAIHSSITEKSTIFVVIKVLE